MFSSPLRVGAHRQPTVTQQSRNALPDPALPPTHRHSPVVDEVNTEDVRKRQRTQELVEALYDDRERKRKRSKDSTTSIKLIGRWLCHVVNPFIDYNEVIVVGSKLQAGVEDSDTVDLSKDDCERISAAYCKVTKFAPTLLEDITLLEDGSDLENPLGMIVQYLEAAAGAGRRDDVASLRPVILSYLPHVLPAHFLGDPPIDTTSNSKSCRGFAHVSTGRLLCPRSKRDKFDEDPITFCMNVRAAQRGATIKTFKYPSFLYPENVYNRANKRQGLLRGPLLIAVYRHIFTGPSSALRDVPGPNNVGHPCICEMHKFEKVTPEMIAYAAIMTRFGLCDKDSWTLQDGKFRLDDFYHCIVALFDGPENEVWSRETLVWWQQMVWGNRDIYGGPTDDDTGYNSDHSVEQDSDVEENINAEDG